MGDAENESRLGIRVRETKYFIFFRRFVTNKEETVDSKGSWLEN